MVLTNVLGDSITFKCRKVWPGLPASGVGEV